MPPASGGKTVLLECVGTGGLLLQGSASGTREWQCRAHPQIRTVQRSCLQLAAECMHKMSDVSDARTWLGIGSTAYKRALLIFSGQPCQAKWLTVLHECTQPPARKRSTFVDIFYSFNSFGTYLSVHSMGADPPTSTDRAVLAQEQKSKKVAGAREAQDHTSTARRVDRNFDQPRA